jgi:hypothetical protein
MTREEAEEMICDLEYARGRDWTEDYAAARKTIVDALCGAAPTTGGAAPDSLSARMRAAGVRLEPEATEPTHVVAPASPGESIGPLIAKWEPLLQRLADGASPGESAAPCTKCHGNGWIWPNSSGVVKCSACGGTGRAGGSHG